MGNGKEKRVVISIPNCKYFPNKNKPLFSAIYGSSSLAPVIRGVIYENVTSE